MTDNYICKDCNYASDTAGNCPYCDMSMEPLDPTKLDQTTGKPEEYDPEEVEKVEKDVAEDPEFVAPDAIDNGKEDDDDIDN